MTGLMAHRPNIRTSPRVVRNQAKPSRLDDGRSREDLSLDIPANLQSLGLTQACLRLRRTSVKQPRLSIASVAGSGTISMTLAPLSP